MPDHPGVLKVAKVDRCLSSCCQCQSVWTSEPHPVQEVASDLWEGVDWSVEWDRKTKIGESLQWYMVGRGENFFSSARGWVWKKSKRGGKNWKLRFFSWNSLSGTLKKHYVLWIPLYLFEGDVEELLLCEFFGNSWLFLLFPIAHSWEEVKVLSEKGDIREVASNLFWKGFITRAGKKLFLSHNQLNCGRKRTGKSDTGSSWEESALCIRVKVREGKLVLCSPLYFHPR